MLLAAANCSAPLTPRNPLFIPDRRHQDLIRLLNSEDEFDDEGVGVGGGENEHNKGAAAAGLASFSDANNDEIDTNQDYRETLAKICGRIYLERERSTSKKQLAANIALLLCAT